MTRPVPNVIVTALICAALPTAGGAAETRYITDEFEVTLRSGTSTSNSIVRMLRSGEAVTVLEEDLATQYSLVETAGQRKGYVLSRFLMEQPAARQTLEELQEKYDAQVALIERQQTEITSLKESLERVKADNEALKTTLRASEQELFEVRSAARDSLQTLEKNKQLQTVVKQLQLEKAELDKTNAELSDSTRLDWFVRGGAVSLIAFVIGILVTRIRWKKQDSWGSY